MKVNPENEYKKAQKGGVPSFCAARFLSYCENENARHAFPLEWQCFRFSLLGIFSIA